MFHMIIITVTLFIMNQGLCSEFDSVLVEIIKMLIFIFLDRFSSVSHYFSAEKAKGHLEFFTISLGCAPEM